MNSKLFASSFVLQNLKNIKLRNQKRNYGHDEHHMTQFELRLANRTTAYLLPQPQGSFAELNNKRQAFNNQTLVIGIVMLLSGSIGPTAMVFWDTALWRVPKG